MTEHDLRGLLEELHEQLQQTESVDGDTEELLRSSIDDIKRLLDERAEDESGEKDVRHSLIEELQDRIEKFEVSHPQITDVLERLINALGQSGI